MWHIRRNCHRIVLYINACSLELALSNRCFSVYNKDQNQRTANKKVVTMKKNYKYIQTPLGKYLLAENGKGITFLEHVASELDPRIEKEIVAGEMVEADTPLLLEGERQLQAYFNGERQKFDLPLDAAGTPFQLKVWEALRQIPYGETRSYKDIAIAVENPKGVRAIGMANNRNPISIITPCHRVIGTSGKLVGYAGGLHLKEYLLNHETKVAIEKG